jgi:predicted Zn-dependent peptidase
MVALFLSAALAAQTPMAVETLRPDRGPTVLLHLQASPLVALRLSAPAAPDLPEGAVELLQELARPRLEDLARRYGARLELRAENGRSVVAVTGPATAFDALVAILRRAAGEPDVSVEALERARARAEDRVLARLEQPGPRVERLLRHALHGGPEPLGAPAAVLDPESIRYLRGRIYDTARVRVVLVGTIPDAVVRSAFTGWPAPGSGAMTAADTAWERARPQTHREWGGLAFPLDAEPALLAVTAELIQRRLQRTVLRYGSVEAWYRPVGALVLIGAAMSDDTEFRTTANISGPVEGDGTAVPAIGRYLRRLVAEAAALAGPGAVATARAAVRRRIMLEARTPDGKAEVIGRIADGLAMDVTPEEMLRRVDGVEEPSVRELLGRMLETTPVIVEAR